jgi:Tol biopolymer transport system component
LGAVKSRLTNTIIYCAVAAALFAASLKAQEQLHDIELVVSASKLNLRGELVNIAISPVDQHVISFESVEGGNLHRLWWYDLRRRSVHQISPREEESDAWYMEAQSDRSINWCPVPINGKNWFIFVSSGTDGRENLYLGNTTDRYYLQLTSSGSVDHHPRWSPDGRRFVYVSSRTGSGDIYLVENVRSIIRRFERQVESRPTDRVIVIDGMSSGERHRRMTVSPEMDSYPDWSPDGRYIVYQGLHRSNGVLNMDLFLIDLENSSGGPINLTENPWQDAIQPKWSYNQEYIAFYASPAGSGNGSGMEMPTSVYLSYIEIQTDPATGEIRSFATQGTIDVNIRRNNNDGPLWGPGSRSLLYVKGDGSNTPILLFKTQGTERPEQGRILKESRFDIIHREIAGFISTDRAIVAFLTFEDQDYNIYIARPGGGVLSRRLHDVYLQPIPRLERWMRMNSTITVGGSGFTILNQNLPPRTGYHFSPQVYLQAAVIPYSADAGWYEIGVRVTAGSVKPSFFRMNERISFSYSLLDVGGVATVPMGWIAPRAAFFFHAGVGLVYSHETVDDPSLPRRVTFPFGVGISYSISQAIDVVAQGTARTVSYRTEDRPYSRILTRGVSFGLAYRIPSSN